MRFWIAPVLLGALAMATVAEGQSASEPRVIDRGVEDLDPMAASLRHVDMGIDGITGRARMYGIDERAWSDQRVPVRPEGGYVVEGAGFTAVLGQMDYLVRTRDGYRRNMAGVDGVERMGLIPANSYFSLVPDRAEAVPELEWRPGQLDLRLDRRFQLGEGVSPVGLDRSEAGLTPIGATGLFEGVFRPYGLDETPPGGW